MVLSVHETIELADELDRLVPLEDNNHLRSDGDRLDLKHNQTARSSLSVMRS